MSDLLNDLNKWFHINHRAISFPRDRHHDLTSSCSTKVTHLFQVRRNERASGQFQPHVSFSWKCLQLERDKSYTLSMLQTVWTNERHRVTTWSQVSGWHACLPSCSSFPTSFGPLLPEMSSLHKVDQNRRPEHIPPLARGLLLAGSFCFALVTWESLKRRGEGPVVKYLCKTDLFLVG